MAKLLTAFILLINPFLIVADDLMSLEIISSFGASHIDKSKYDSSATSEAVSSLGLNKQIMKIRGWGTSLSWIMMVTSNG